MKLCWMFALLLALAVGVRGGNQDMGKPPNIEDVISGLTDFKSTTEPSELEDTGELFKFIKVINMNGELIPYTMVGDVLPRRQTRSLSDYFPEFLKKAISAVRKALPTTSRCTEVDWTYSCCVVPTSSSHSEHCFQIEIDLHKLELRVGLIVNKEKIGGWIWQGGKLCAGIPLTMFQGCIIVYYLKWDIDKKEVEMCVMVSWMSVLIIDYGCFHFDEQKGFNTIKLEPGDNAALVKITFADGKLHIDFWKPKNLKETASGIASMVTGQSIKLGDWRKPYI